MVKHLTDNIRMHIKSMLLLYILVLVGWIFGTLLLSIILWADETAVSWFCLGTILALFVMCGVMLLFFWKYHQEFMLALSMGQTRKAFMITYALRQILWTIAAYAVILLLYRLEGLYYQVMFPDKAQAFALGVLTDWRFVVPFVLGLALLPMFLGAMYGRFGNRFLVIVYFIWMGSCILIPRLINHGDEYTGPFQTEIGAAAAWIVGLPPLAWVAAGLALVAVMAFTTIRFGMKQMVR